MKSNYFIYSSAITSFESRFTSEGNVEVPERLLKVFEQVGFKNECIQHQDIILKGEELILWKDALETTIKEIILNRTPIEMEIKFQKVSIMGQEMILDPWDDMDNWLRSLDHYKRMAVSAIERNKSVNMIFLNSINEAPEDLKKLYYDKLNR